MKVGQKLVEQSLELPNLDTKLFLNPLQIRIPGFELEQLLLLKLGVQLPLGPASAARNVVEMSSSPVAGLGRIAHRRQGNVR